MTDLADTLAAQLNMAGLGGFEREYHFMPGRRFRADIAFISQRLLVEADGATWKGTAGGHTSGTGKERDCRRDAEAVVLGYRVMRFTRSMIESGEALGYIERALGKGEA